MTLDPVQNDAIHILVVDDQPENLLSMEAVLTSPDIKQVLVRSGKEALRAVLVYDFALILMDVQMPVMDGFETAELIRQRGRSRLTPIIFVTAINKSDRNMFQGYSFGAVDYVFKPYMPEILKAKVDVFVELFRNSLEVRAEGEGLARVNRELELACQILTLDYRATLKRSASLLEDLQKQNPDLAESDPLRLRLDDEARKNSKISAWLHDFSESSRGELLLQRVSLARLCTEEVAGLGMEAAAVRWEVQDLPEVRGDEDLLRIALRHLLRNSVRFALGVASPEVEVGSFSDKEGTVVFIKDNGPGFEVASDEDLMGTFQRIGSAGAFEGVGISLVVAQRIIRRHGGRIWATTNPGVGTVVSFLVEPVQP